MFVIDFEYNETNIIARTNITINKMINSILLTKLCKKIIIINEANDPIVPGAHLI